MKKILTCIAVAFALLMTVDANAQLGIVGGFTSSNTKIDTQLDIKNVSLYHAGIAYRADMGLIALQPALTYQMKGAVLAAGDVQSALATLQTNTGFLELGVGIQVVPLNLGVAKLYAFAEPFVGYAITNFEETSGSLAGIISGSGSASDLAKTEKNKLEYGFGLGIGAMVVDHIQVSAQWFTNLGKLYGENDNISVDAISGAVKSAFKSGNYQGIKVSVGFFF